MSPLRVAIIGSTGHPAIPLDAIHRVPNIQIVGLAPGAPEDNFDHLRERYPLAAAAPLFADHRQLLTQTRPDLVVIATRLDRVAPAAIDAAAAGCHLICEKPLAIDHAHLRELRHAVSQGRRHCIPIMDNRLHPVLQAATAAIRAGRIGRVVLANARKSYKWGTRPEWFGDRQRYGGTIPWIGIHALDFIHAVAAQPFTTVAAMQSNAAHPDRPGCEDNCTLLLELETGIHATASLDYFRPAGAGTWGDDWIRVVGTQGVIEAYLDRRSCTLLPAQGQPEELPLPQAITAFDAFLQSLVAGQPYPFDATETGFLLTHAVLCARDAADQRQVIPILPME